MYSDHILYCIIHIQNSGIFRTLFIQVYTGISTHIEALLRHIQFIQTYSTPCVTLTYSQYCCIPSPYIFRTGAYSKSCETLTRNIQNSATVRTVYSGNIQPYSDIFRAFSNPGICCNYEFWPSWNTQNHSIIAS